MTTEEQEMFDGYIDGLDPNSPDPSDNRSHSYKHGFANGRDDMAGKGPRAIAAKLRVLAKEAIRMDKEQ